MDVVWFKVPRPDFQSADPHARFYLGQGHLLIAAPIYDAKLQVAWIIPKGSFGEIRESGLPDCIQAMARHVSPDLAQHLLEHRNRATEPFLLRVVSDRVEEWTKPGALLIGDAAHTMSPVGAQGLNIALRDAIVAANQLVPVLSGDAAGGEIDAAARRVQQERLPEVRTIQRIQAIPPQILLRDTWWSRAALRVLPALMRSDILRARSGGTVFRRMVRGVTNVRLEV
jgi:2-polyprenyl-6-methoxyphenol hydroxylase-like FAD-dependent oxidoreductase